MIRYVSGACCLFIGLVTPAASQVLTAPPEGLTDVGVTERRGELLPLEMPFVDSRGDAVRLGQFFDGRRPVVLSFNYASCPMLCKLQLNGLVDSLREIEWDAGEQFRVVSVSIDPSETTSQAAISKQNHLNAYGRPGAGDGWSFLTGSVDSIRATAEAAGFGYRYLPETREYSHAATVLICTPDGRISQYLYGVQFDPQTIRLALSEASAGEIGSVLDQLLLFCFRYDTSAGRYVPIAWKIMRVGALGTLAALTVLVVPMWFRSRSGVLPAEERATFEDRRP